MEYWNNGILELHYIIFFHSFLISASVAILEEITNAPLKNEYTNASTKTCLISVFFEKKNHNFVVINDNLRIHEE